MIFHKRAFLSFLWILMAASWASFSLMLPVFPSLMTWVNVSIAFAGAILVPYTAYWIVHQEGGVVEDELTGKLTNQMDEEVTKTGEYKFMKEVTVSKDTYEELQEYKGEDDDWDDAINKVLELAARGKMYTATHPSMFGGHPSKLGEDKEDSPASDVDPKD